MTCIYGMPNDDINSLVSEIASFLGKKMFLLKSLLTVSISKQFALRC